MLDVPTEIAAIVKTKMIVIAIEGLGHDPLRANPMHSGGGSASATTGPDQFDVLAGRDLTTSSPNPSSPRRNKARVGRATHLC